MPDIGHPARRRLDEAEAQLGKQFGNSIRHQIAEGHHRQDAIVGEGVIALDIEELHQVAAARAGVDAKGQYPIFPPRRRLE